MFDNQREKTLAGLLGGAVVLGFGFQTIDNWLLQPAQNVQAQVNATRAKNQQLALDLQTIEHAQRNLKAIRNQSLPSEPATASMMYQGWLMDRVNDARLNEAVVTPGRAIAEEGVGHRIPFTVQATASLRQIGRFLDDFYSTQTLHRITFLKIDSQGQSASTTRKLTLTLEALALADAPVRESLPAPDRKASHTPNRPTLENYFARRDPFRRTVIEPARTPVVASTPSPAPVSKPTPKIDSLATMRLVASISKAGQREAWFFDTRTNKELIVTIGEDLNLTGFSGRVVGIDAESITLASQDQSHVTRLGQTLRESIKPVVN